MSNVMFVTKNIGGETYTFRGSPRAVNTLTKVHAACGKRGYGIGLPPIGYSREYGISWVGTVRLVRLSKEGFQVWHVKGALRTALSNFFSLDAVHWEFCLHELLPGEYAYIDPRAIFFAHDSMPWVSSRTVVLPVPTQSDTLRVSREGATICVPVEAFTAQVQGYRTLSTMPSAHDMQVIKQR